MGEFLLQRRDSHFRGATALAFARGLTWLEILRLPRRARWPETALDEFVSDGGAAETLDAGSDFSVTQQKIPNRGIGFNFVTRFFPTRPARDRKIESAFFPGEKTGQWILWPFTDVQPEIGREVTRENEKSLNRDAFKH